MFFFADVDMFETFFFVTLGSYNSPTQVGCVLAGGDSLLRAGRVRSRLRCRPFQEHLHRHELPEAA
jgi:hypothetical protein